MKQNQKTKNLVLLALLCALLILMAFTPLGYLRVWAISITFNMIPVAIGAIALGNYAGALLGLIFGITSFVQCFGMDAFGTFLAEKNVFFAFIMCVVARVIAGFLTSVINKTFEKVISNITVRCSLTGLAASVLNTLLFVGSMVLLYGKMSVSEATGGAIDSSVNIISFIASICSINAVWEAIAAFIVTGAIGTGLYKARLISSKKLVDKKEKENA